MVVNRLREVVDNRSGLHQAHEAVLLDVDVDHPIGQMVQEHLGTCFCRQRLQVAVRRVHSTREVLTVVVQDFTPVAKPHRGLLVELGVARDVDTAVNDETHRVHAFRDTRRRVGDVLGEKGLYVDVTHGLFPGVNPKAVELVRPHEVEEVAHEHLALGAVQVDLFAEGEASTQRPTPEHLGVVVRCVEVWPVLPRAAGSHDALHVEAERLIFALWRIKEERRLVALLERQFFDTTDVIGMRMGDEEVADVVDRQAELRHLHRGLGAEVDEQRRVSFHDDEVRLEHAR